MAFAGLSMGEDEMEYGAIIKRAWEIMWRHKVLWVLGLFAGISGGCQGGGGSGGGGDFTGGQGGSGPDFDFTGMPDFEAFAEWLPLIIGVVALLVFLGILWWILSFAARGGLIVGVNEIESGNPVRLGELWAAGFSRIFAQFGLSFILALPTFVIAVVMIAVAVVPLVSTLIAGNEPSAALAAPVCGSLAIGIPLLIVVGFLLDLIRLIAQRYLMIGGRRVFESIGDAWRFIRGDFKNSFLMYLINSGLNIVASIVIAIPIFLVALAVLAPTLITMRSGDMASLFVGVGVMTLLITIIGFLYSAIWGTFTSALWTIFFRKMTGMEVAVAPMPQPVVPVAPAGWQPPVAPAPQAPAPPAPEPPVAPQPPAPPQAPDA